MRSRCPLKPEFPNTGGRKQARSQDVKLVVRVLSAGARVARLLRLDLEVTVAVPLLAGGLAFHKESAAIVELHVEVRLAIGVDRQGRCDCRIVVQRVLAGDARRRRPVPLPRA